MINYLFVSYNMVFGSDCTESDPNLLKGFTQLSLIRVIARMNFLTSEFGKFIFNKETSLEIWQTLFKSHTREVERLILVTTERYYDKNNSKTVIPVFFNRFTNLAILKKALDPSKPVANASDDKIDSAAQLKFLKFYIKTTQEIMLHESFTYPGDIKSEYKLALKNLPSTLYKHHYQISTDVVAWAMYIFNEIESHCKFGKEFRSFLSSRSIGHHSDVVYTILNLMIWGYRNKAKPESFKFGNPSDPKNNRLKPTLNQLSNHSYFINNHLLDFTIIKKWPLYFNRSKEEYLILDFDFLVEKLIGGLLDDFWFDYLAPKGHQIKEYRGLIGKLFETKICTELKVLFESRIHQNFDIKFSNQLLIRKESGDVEIGDFFARYKNRIALFEIKSSSLTIAQSTGKSEDILKSDLSGLQELWKKFGIKQLAKSVAMFLGNPNLLTNHNKIHYIYPCLVVQENFLTAPLSIAMFRSEFKTQLKTHISDEQLLAKVRPLSILSILDTMRLSKSIKTKIWYLMDFNHHQGESFIKEPLEISLNRQRIRRGDVNRKVLLEIGVSKR